MSSQIVVFFRLVREARTELACARCLENAFPRECNHPRNICRRRVAGFRGREPGLKARRGDLHEFVETPISSLFLWILILEPGMRISRKKEVLELGGVLRWAADVCHNSGPQLHVSHLSLNDDSKNSGRIEKLDFARESR